MLRGDDDVAELQRRLTALGFNAGPAPTASSATSPLRVDATSNAMRLVAPRSDLWASNTCGICCASIVTATRPTSAVHYANACALLDHLGTAGAGLAGRRIATGEEGGFLAGGRRNRPDRAECTAL